MSFLSDDEEKIVAELTTRIDRRAARYELLDDVYEGLQQLEIMGIAVPPELHSFTFPFEWPRTCVDANVHRMDVKGFLVSGEVDSNKELQELWDVNDLEAHSELVHNEALVQGLSFVSVGTNPDNRDEPFITPESSRYIALSTDPRTNKTKAGLRLYASSDELGAPVDAGALYLPDETVWYQKTSQGFEVIERDQHRSGFVPLVPFINRRRLGASRRDWRGNWREAMWGQSEMAPVIQPTVMAAGVVVALRLGVEISAVPRAVLRGVNKQMTDQNGELISGLEAYMQSMWVIPGEGTVQSIAPADLSNFTGVITALAQQAASASFLPWEYFGLHTGNPASAEAIVANETRLAKLVERRNRVFGAAWGNVLAMAESMRGKQILGNRVLTQWHDPGTPTFSQKADGIQKLAGGQAILSREGAWDEMGFSPERKEREREYFRQELGELNTLGDPTRSNFNQDLPQVEVPEPEQVTDPTMGGLLLGKAA